MLNSNRFMWESLYIIIACTRHLSGRKRWCFNPQFVSNFGHKAPSSGHKAPSSGYKAEPDLYYAKPQPWRPFSEWERTHNSYDFAASIFRFRFYMKLLRRWEFIFEISNIILMVKIIRAKVISMFGDNRTILLSAGRARILRCSHAWR